MTSILLSHNGLIVQEKRQGCCCCTCCCSNCFNCDEFEAKVIPKHSPFGSTIMFVKEESACLIRYCCPAIHPYKMTLHEGDSTSGKPVAYFKRPCHCHVCCCKPCCYQEINVYNAQDEYIGVFRETCWLGHPKFINLDKDGKLIDRVEYPSCCCGLCYNPCSLGCCRCGRIPFDIYPMNDNSWGADGKIEKLFEGLVNDAADAQRYQIIFPSGNKSDADSRARLLGGLLLLHEIFFEYGKTDK